MACILKLDMVNRILGQPKKKEPRYDMFPHATHVETVILMTRCGKNDK